MRLLYCCKAYESLTSYTQPNNKTAFNHISNTKHFFQPQKMKKLLPITLLFLCLGFVQLFAQNGTVRGAVTDDSNADPIMFGNVLVKELGTGTTTDLDGMFSIDLAAGAYTFEFSYIGYQAVTVSDVEVVEGETQILNISIKESSQTIEEVVITAKQARNSAAAVNKLKQKSVSLVDGIASESFSLSGDNDAAAAIKRVPGVSIEGGKHVFIRGLGDRYTRTLLNNMDVPGLDPDKNSVQMDIFPSNLIDNIVVYKTFTPDLPGDFTGGMVDISTKDFPETKTLGLSVGLGFNPDMHLQKNALTYSGSQTDFLGFDNGLRALPFSADAEFPKTTDQNPLLNTYTASFNPQMATETKSQLPNLNTSFSSGNQYDLGKATLGYIVALNYRAESSFFQEVEFNEYTKNRTDLTITDLEPNRRSNGSLGENSVLWSTLVGTALKFKKHKYSLTAMRFQNGVSKSGFFMMREFEDNPSIIQRQNLEYSQRAISSINLSGQHSLNEGKTVVDWKLTGINSSIDEPDIRSTPFEITDEGRYIIDRSVGAIPTRSFRYLEEMNLGGKANIERKFLLKNGNTTKIKAGIANSYKTRDYSILRYDFPVNNPSAFNFTGNPDELFMSDNIWSNKDNSGTFVEGGQELANQYESSQNIAAAYIMNEMPLTANLKAIYGLRAEQTQIIFSGQNNRGDLVLDNEKILNDLDLLPSVNLVYELNKNMNLRSSYARTVARPTFKEKSLVQIQDFISGRTFLGNLDLESSSINNYDLRAEYFFTGAGIVSLSGFYKQIDNPIEIVAYGEIAPDNIQAKNVDEANVLGLELEVNRSFAIAGSQTRKFNVVMNLTAVDAKTTMSTEEYESRLAKARPGENVTNTRAMVGQSPFVVNASLGYTDRNSGWEANLNYNVQGKRLSVAGISIVPDVYEMPFHLLNFKIVKKMGKDHQYKLSLGANNLLDSERQLNYQSYKTADQVYSRLRPGRSFSIGFNYALR